VAGGVAAAILAMLGFFARFVFKGVFERLDSMQAEIKASNDEQLAKLEKMAEALSEQKTARALTELRLAHLETAFESFRQKYDDLAGFLQSQGFKKRDG
jgi:septal ring factor EnvC (AmiA/AmiB activator)